MDRHKSSHPRQGETRREFLKKAGKTALAVTGAGLMPISVTGSESRGSVSIVLDSSEAVTTQSPVVWATDHLRDSLIARGVAAQIVHGLDSAPVSRDYIFVSSGASARSRQMLDSAQLSLSSAPESLALTRGKLGARTVLLAAGSGARGLVYALLELADRVQFADDPLRDLKALKPISESPANTIRSLGRAFASDVEDKPWFNDRDFWTRYLTMLAANRFNRVNLTFGLAYDFTRDITDCYFHFAYPFLLPVPGYNVRAVPLPDSERDANLEMLRFASDEAARRGMQFQLGIWTHAYQWTNSPRANYTIEGLTPDTQGPYCRDALRLLLTKCPNITGVTIRTHGESGVTEGNTDIWKTVFDGVAKCGRKVEIDLHAKGIDMGIIDAALATEMPVTISPKFWAEHMGLPYMQGAIRELEMPPQNTRDNGFFSRSTGSRSFLRYGYGDLLAENRRYGILHRIWPGTQRVLLWGNPETAAAYSRVSSFCGSNGVELYEPLFFKGRKGSGLPGGRDAYADLTLKPQPDFEKYDYTYRVWGRNFYNPETDADGWRRLLRKQSGRSAEHAEAALSSAGKILPLVTTAHCPSAANNLYWPEMYWNMPMVDLSQRHPYSDTRNPKRFDTVSPLDPEFFLSCDEFAEELLKGEYSGKYSPAWVAARLEEHAGQTFSHLAKLKSNDRQSVDFRRLKIDATIQAGLGKFFAAKFRSGVLCAIHLRTKDHGALEKSLGEYRSARAAWVDLANVAKGVYRDDVTYGPDYYQRGHWVDRLTAMDADIAAMEKLLAASVESSKKAQPIPVENAVRAVLKKGKRNEHLSLSEFHTPAASFQRGKAVLVVARIAKASTRSAITGLRLRYRRVNQAERWQMVEMTKSAEEFRATISSEYTDSPFPLQYHFQIREDAGRAWLFPGLERTWNGQPYFVVRQT